jgi:SAM-dependent methyltransferase
MSTDHEPDAMKAEFDTVAEWTADAAIALGPDHFIPAGCRGTGHPAAFDWLLERLPVGNDVRLVDVGAGVGGAAAYAAAHSGVRPVLFEPAAGACRAARRLFEYPVACADATALPITSGAVSCAWSLGVLCTTSDHVAVLREMRRILRPAGCAGLLVFVAERPEPPGEPDGNHFPTAGGLRATIAAAELEVVDESIQSRLAQVPARWNELADETLAYVRERHGDEDAWQAAADESAAVGKLLADGTVYGQLLVVRRG